MVLIDFVAHEHRWMEHELGLLWMGFEEELVREWIQNADLEEPHIEFHAPDEKRDLPASFVAAARKRPGSCDG